jgi:hypothetical protein
LRHVLAQRGHQAGVVERGRAQVGADLADAGGGVGEQGRGVLEQRGELAADGFGQGFGETGEQDLQCREVGAGAVVERAGEFAALALLDLDQMARELLQAFQMLQALGFQAP